LHDVDSEIAETVWNVQLVFQAFECFEEGTVPTEYTKRPDEVSEAEDFFKKDL
jgi:hypothetical protein